MITKLQNADYVSSNALKMYILYPLVLVPIPCLLAAFAPCPYKRDFIDARPMKSYSGICLDPKDLGFGYSLAGARWFTEFIAVTVSKVYNYAGCSTIQKVQTGTKLS